MTSKDLLDATMRLDQSFLDEADIRAAAALPSGRKRIRLIPALTAAAACLAAVIGLRFYSLHHNGLTEQNSAPDSIVAEVSDTETTTAITETTASDAEAKHTATTIVSSTKTQKSKKTESTATTAAVSETAKTNTTKTNAESKGNTTTTQAAKSDTASSTTTTTSRNRAGTTVVPHLLYTTWEHAEELAKYHEVKVTKKVVDYFGDDYAHYTGLVVAQSIEFDTEVEKGTVIELTVLSGELNPEEDYVNVPHFYGMTWSQAEYAAKSSELKPIKQIVKEGNGRKGTVQSQSLREGHDDEDPVKPGTTITLTVLEGEPDPIPVMLWFRIFNSYIGKYHINLYEEDGQLVAAGPQFQPEYSSDRFYFDCTPLQFAGEGASAYEAILINDETGEEAKIGRYYIDFDTMSYAVLEENSVQAFRQLGGIAPGDTHNYECNSKGDQTRIDFYTRYYNYNNDLYRYPRTYEVQFKLPSKPELPENTSTTYKIIAYADGIASADSGWFDASVPDSVITMTLKDDGLGCHSRREYLFELYQEDLEEPTYIGRILIKYFDDTPDIECWPHNTIFDSVEDDADYITIINKN